MAPNMEMELPSRGAVRWSGVPGVRLGAAARSSFPGR